jgi:hypothetical protein
VTGDPIWYDANGDGLYTAGETIVYAGSAAPQVGDLGKQQGVCFYDAAGTGKWDPSDTLVWVDQTTFRQDFAAFYPALEALAPKFGRTDGAAYPNDLQSVGSILQSLGAPTQTFAGTISLPAWNPGTMPYGVTTVTASGADLTADLVDGDSILVGGNWYPVSSWSGSTLTLAQPYFGPGVGGAAFKAINWTLIPEEATVPGEPGLSFTYQRGRPTAGGVVFAEQFAELKGVLNALTQLPDRYDVALYDADSSQAFIAAATAALNDYQSLFGPVPETAGGAEQPTAAQQLRDLLLAGGADPG